ncbi:hypothetical protein [Roseisolibacter sp. H3M3-2]|uniref:hypothetical protein n=1 Tax=Roseisolibacter sp. H3M3-2 TaxID=3031323 RepID=UPI0023DC9F25|nr:hypothetical protein [Roseisolibacter sp. H3M3-2]MDF1501361.1 hypothetical protein [Roseisolibacter sp. H3M3-2]
MQRSAIIPLAALAGGCAALVACADPSAAPVAVRGAASGNPHALQADVAMRASAPRELACRETRPSLAGDIDQRASARDSRTYACPVGETKDPDVASTRAMSTEESAHGILVVRSTGIGGALRFGLPSAGGSWCSSGRRAALVDVAFRDMLLGGLTTAPDAVVTRGDVPTPLLLVPTAA